MPGEPPVVMRGLEYIQGLLLEVGVSCDGDFTTSASNAPNGNSCTKIPGMYKSEQPSTHVLAIHDYNV